MISYTLRRLAASASAFPYATTALAMNYYVRVGEDNAGPFSLEELARRGVAVDEYVWREGLADWTLAGELPEVASALRKSQPTFTPPPSNDSPYRSPTQDYVD
ncbi:MAG: DUF4339 domain-containing protein [Planctomycetales bacterium]|nr:DUF4339 domain-containing protein [Planctomycetales bacterium]